MKPELLDTKARPKSLQENYRPIWPGLGRGPAPDAVCQLGSLTFRVLHSLPACPVFFHWPSPNHEDAGFLWPPKACYMAKTQAGS